MSYSVNGTTITLTRGDTLKLAIKVYSGDAEYKLQPGDSIRFAMKSSYEATSVLVEKTIPTDTLILKLNPTDTKTLSFGKYVYDIQLTYANGDVDTFIKGIVKLTEEVV